MSHPQLDNLVHIGQLKAEPPSEAECQGLLRSGLRRLEDAGLNELSLESRFDLAYNAAHALSLAACAIGGTGPSRVILYFNVCNTRSICQKSSGVYSIRSTASAIWPSMRVTWMLMNNSLRR